MKDMRYQPPAITIPSMLMLRLQHTETLRDSENNERDDNTDEQQRTYDYPADVRQAEEEPIYDSAGGSGRSSQRTASYVEILNGQQHYNNMAVSGDFPNSSIFSN